MPSTAGPTSSRWARSSARSSPARPAFAGELGDRDPRAPRAGPTRPRRWTGWRAAGPTRSCWPWPATAWPPEAKDRPADAGVVAERLTGYLAGVQERLREAELSRAAESARAEEAEAKASAERRARRLTAALAATVLLAGRTGRRRLAVGRAGAAGACSGKRPDE